MQAGFREALSEDSVIEIACVVWQEQLRRIKLKKESSSSATASLSSCAQKQQHVTRGLAILLQARSVLR